MNFFEKILRLIYPIKCVFCQGIISNDEEAMCIKCKKITKVFDKLKTYFKDESFSFKAISPFCYENQVKDAILRFKFRNCKNYAQVFAEIISDMILKNFRNTEFDFVTFVPLSKRCENQRGYNQSKILAENIAFNLSLKCYSTILKIKDNLPQHELSRQDRTENVKNMYRAVEKIDVMNKNILICDDVITTGNTMAECAKILYTQGARNVTCCSVAFVNFS